ncbi:hypothetical protein E2562_003943 [Oryza meyeriana var. granulata]|uniref:Uncharacterized protein n=1 Tax=Oryza meyeriana var. granulata TaxID=110450 RepID=A0A6G1CYU6_9ORYZ|nr:hypothetical protein E2562_003943 [Oryza meyeriana var. granulata]
MVDVGQIWKEGVLGPHANVRELGFSPSTALRPNASRPSTFRPTNRSVALSGGAVVGGSAVELPPAAAVTRGAKGFGRRPTTPLSSEISTVNRLSRTQSFAAMAGLGDGRPTQCQRPTVESREGPAHTTTTTTIHSLGEDLLLAIFLRLPSLAALVRAALTCRAWRRAVASSPVFRRRFRAVHPAPLLGLFFSAPAPAQAPNLPAFPSFAPARPRDRDMAAAVRGGDFFLTSLQDRLDEEHCWDMIDCCRGYCLLMNWDDGLFVVLNPLTRRTEFVVGAGSAQFFEGACGQHHPVELNARLLCSDGHPKSFRLVVLALDDSRVRANICSSDTGEWSVLPWVDIPEPVRSDDSNCWILNEGSMQANGFLYWVYDDLRYLVSLDTATMVFSVVQLPQCLSGCYFDVGETKDGATCIVYAHQLDVGVLMHTKDDDGAERWVVDRVVPLGKELEQVLQAGLHDDSVLIHLVDNPSQLFVLAVRDGYVYLATSMMFHDPQSPCWFLSLCLETMKLERLFRRTFDNDVHPYIMAWPPSLVGNYGRFAVQDAS